MTTAAEPQLQPPMGAAAATAADPTPPAPAPAPATEAAAVAAQAEAPPPSTAQNAPAAPVTSSSSAPEAPALEAAPLPAPLPAPVPAQAPVPAPAPAPASAVAAAPIDAEKKSAVEKPAEAPADSKQQPRNDGIDDINPQDFSGEVQSNNDLPSAETLRKIENYTVLDRHGKSHLFRSLYTGRNVARRVLVIFVRHFFCGNCQEYLRTLSASITPEALLRLPISTFITVVGCGDPRLIDMYVRETGCPFPVYADPTRRLYDELGMVRTLAMGQRPAYMRKSMLLSALSSVAQGLRQVPSGKATKAGDHRQIGGEFLFEPLTVHTPAPVEDDLDRRMGEHQLHGTSIIRQTIGEDLPPKEESGIVANKESSDAAAATSAPVAATTTETKTATTSPPAEAPVAAAAAAPTPPPPAEMTTTSNGVATTGTNSGNTPRESNVSGSRPSVQIPVQHDGVDEEEGYVEDKQVTWCHRMRTTRDHAEIPELMEVLGLDGQGVPIKDNKRWSRALETRKGTGLSMASQMSAISSSRGSGSIKSFDGAAAPVASGKA